MVNDPELDGKYLGTITQDFVKIAKVLQEASYQIRARKISAHPIFPITKQTIAIGQILVEKGQLSLDWNYYISFLEEFVQRNLIEPDREEYFKESYKDPDEFCCLFVVDTATNFTNFVYIPFPDDDFNEAFEAIM